MYKSRLIYLAILIASFIFSQALYESVSFMTFIIVLLLPVFSILFALLSYPLVSVKALGTGNKVDRFEKYILRLVIKNMSPFISPSFKVKCTVPNQDGTGSEIVVFVFNSSFARKGSFDYNCFFAFRGTHSILVKYIEYYDFLKLIKVKRHINAKINIEVCPRNINVPVPVSSQQQNQDSSNVVGTSTVVSGGDVIGVREYVAGDNIRNIHWKLSAKSEDLVVKSFAENIFDKAFVIIDMSSYFADEILNRKLLDCVVEVGLSVVKEYFSNGIRFSLIINTDKSSCTRYSIGSPSDLYEAETALSKAEILHQCSIIDSLRNFDFSLISGCDVCFVSSYASFETLKSIRKLFIDQKCDLNVVNIAVDDTAVEKDVIVYSKDYIENYRAVK